MKKKQPAEAEHVGGPAIPDLKMLNRIISIKHSYQFYGKQIPITTKKWLLGEINRDIKMKYN